MKSLPLAEGPHTNPRSSSAVPVKGSNSTSSDNGNKAKPNIKTARPRNMNTFQRDFFSDARKDDNVSTVCSISCSTSSLAT